MNNILKVSLIVVVSLIAAGGLFFAGSMFGSFAFQRMDGNRNMPMFRNGQDNQDGQNDQGQLPPNGRNNDRDGQRQGQGNLPGQRGGRMGGGPGMGMGGPFGNRANLTPVTTEEATKAAQDYITSLKIDGLEVGEVLIVDAQAYVAVKETATGNGAFELIVDPVNKQAHPLMGISSAWNLKYGGVLQANGMMRHGLRDQVTATPSAAATAAPAATPADVSADMPLSATDAIKAAQMYLDTNYAGATAATTALKFYGYYSIDFSKDGKVIGKLSVNGYNGQVVGHEWRMDGRP